MTLAPEERRKCVEDFRKFGPSSTPLYTRICEYVADNPAVLDILEDAPEGRRRQVNLLAAVHYLVLRDGDRKLGAIYEAPEARASLEEAGPAFVQFCDDYYDDIVEALRERGVQTNEVNRCVGLLPALMHVQRQTRKSLALIELGASAGLNLLFDRYRYDYAGGPVIGPPGAQIRLHTQLRGRVPLLDSAAPMVDQRIGIDLEPIDVSDEDEVMWLRACIAVGDVARDQRLTAAVALARREWPDVRSGDAIQLLPQVANEVSGSVELCLFSSWMLGWMNKDDRAAMTRQVKELSLDRPVWWITFEPAGRAPNIETPSEVPDDASLVGLQRWHDGQVEGRLLGLAQHWGAWLDWLDAETTAW